MADMGFNEIQSLRLAAGLEEVAGAMRNLAAGELSEAIGRIETSWGGDGANLFFRHCDETRQRLIARASGIDEQARLIREAVGMREKS